MNTMARTFPYSIVSYRKIPGECFPRMRIPKGGDSVSRLSGKRIYPHAGSIPPVESVTNTQSFVFHTNLGFRETMDIGHSLLQTFPSGNLFSMFWTSTRIMSVLWMGCQVWRAVEKTGYKIMITVTAKRRTKSNRDHFNIFFIFLFGYCLSSSWADRQQCRMLGWTQSKRLRS